MEHISKSEGSLISKASFQANILSIPKSEDSQRCGPMVALRHPCTIRMHPWKAAGKCDVQQKILTEPIGPIRHAAIIWIALNIWMA
jgi:hypothetical protein